MDIVALIIALLRASRIPARYVHGAIDVPIAKLMNWAGGFTNAEAALPFTVSGDIPTEQQQEMYVVSQFCQSR